MNVNLLIEQLLRVLNEQEEQWLTQQLTLLSQSTDCENDLLNASVITKRTITSDLSLEFLAIQEDVTDLSITSCLANCLSHEIVRIILIHSALTTVNEADKKQLLKQYYRLGDSSEKCALLKGLALLDEQGLSVNIAINAARCNDQVEFAALALHNDYVTQHFPDHNFNQLVLKSLFMGFDISLISQLNTRVNAALTNMSFDYAIEQALSDRIPPASLWLTVFYQDLTPENQQQCGYYLQHFAKNDVSHKQIIAQLMNTGQLPNTSLS